MKILLNNSPAKFEISAQSDKVICLTIETPFDCISEIHTTTLLGLDDNIMLEFKGSHEHLDLGQRQWKYARIELPGMSQYSVFQTGSYLNKITLTLIKVIED